MNKRIAIVTGASSGMGQEFVKQLDICLRTVKEIWVIARREEKLLELQEQVANIKLRILPLDICQETDLNILEALLEAEQPQVRLLINAAGVGRAGRFDEITKIEATNMVDVNTKALVVITHMVLPYMARKSSIIQIASASAFMPQKEFAVYAASKAFVLSFTRALRAELAVTDNHISVTAVCPGPVNTEFLAISNAGMKQKPLKKLVTAKVEPVVAKALRDAKDGKEISVYGLSMKAVWVASKILPHNLFL